MRNLLAYPITEKEVLDLLSLIPVSEGIGNTDSYIKNSIIEHFSNPLNMQSVLQSMEIKPHIKAILSDIPEWILSDIPECNK